MAPTVKCFRDVSIVGIICVFSAGIFVGARCRAGSADGETAATPVHIPLVSASDPELISAVKSANALIASTSQFLHDSENFIKVTGDNVKPRPGHRATSTVEVSCMFKDGRCTNVECKNIDGAGYSIDYPEGGGVATDLVTLQGGKQDGFGMEMARSGYLLEYFECHDGKVFGKYLGWTSDGKVAESGIARTPTDIGDWMMGVR